MTTTWTGPNRGIHPWVVGSLSLTEDGSRLGFVAGKHLLAYSDAHRLKAVNLTTGLQASITAARIPYLDAAYNTAAW